MKTRKIHLYIALHSGVLYRSVEAICVDMQEVFIDLKDISLPNIYSYRCIRTYVRAALCVCAQFK